MSEKTVLEATLRSDMGKGASRRLRRNQRVPAIIYGGKKAPKAIALDHNKVLQAMDHESFYSSVFALSIDGKEEQVVLKDLHRHPFKPKVVHMDFQRVSASVAITKSVPLHFLNEDTSAGVKAGGIVAHLMNEVEVACLPKNLPASIDIDLKALELDSTLHLSDIVLPKGVELTTDLADSSHDHPVVSINTPKKAAETSETTDDAEAPDTED